MLFPLCILFNSFFPGTDTFSMCLYILKGKHGVRDSIVGLGPYPAVLRAFSCSVLRCHTPERTQGTTIQCTILVISGQTRVHYMKGEGLNPCINASVSVNTSKPNSNPHRSAAGSWGAAVCFSLTMWACNSRPAAPDSLGPHLQSLFPSLPQFCLYLLFM